MSAGEGIMFDESGEYEPLDAARLSEWLRARLAIPDEAVEVAARAMSGFDPWNLVPDMRKSLLRRDAKNALEAAASHMLAEAFEQGQKSGIRHATRLAAAVRMGRCDLPGPMSPNPYRSQP